MHQTPVPSEIVKAKIKDNGLQKVGTASIREIKKLVDTIEKASGVKFIRMEMGIPGLPPSKIGIDAQVEALRKGVAAKYPDIQGIPELKEQISNFVKNFMNISVSPDSCLPTVGSMQGGFASFLTLSRIHKERDTTLFID
ncbi:MAG TPA: pyridoxal phosphate-dependent aminotransferase, partial [Bacteroidales bacterium]|nr:pyridoxal phosphate-dependent aminotransferase [Bacteroidales bacterium]